MSMNKNKKAQTWILALIAIVLILGVGTFMYVQLTGLSEKKEATDGVGEPMGGVAFSKYVIDPFFRPIDQTAQDADSDLEYDIFVWDATKNDDLKADGIMDCSEAEPIVFDGKTTSYDLTEANKCKMNWYKWFRDSKFNGADEELEIDDHLVTWISDLAEENTSELRVGKEYLYIVTESASTDTWDAEPLAFIIKSVSTTTLDVDSIESGNVQIGIDYRYYSDAVSESKISFDGSCSDSENEDPLLGTSIDNVLSSSLSGQPSNFNTECDVIMTVTKNGYRTYFEDNGLADGNTERSYIQAYPIVMGYNGSGETATATKITTPAVTGTGRVKYTQGNNITGAGNYTLWESLSVCGIEITDDDATNADVHIGDKLYQGNDINCLTDAFDKGGKTVIPIKLTNIQNVNYSQTACSTISSACADEILANGDEIVNITIGHLASAVDPFSHVLTA